MILVTRGIIVQNDAVLAAQRPATMSLPFLWELPGGKLEEDESPELCLARETMEELGLEIEIIRELAPVDNQFKERTYRMLPYVCEVSGGVIENFEHEKVEWIPIDSLFSVEWAPAEKKLLRTWLDSKKKKALMIDEFSISSKLV